MQTETLNNIVRNVLINKGYPLHYYLPILHRAIKGVRNISKDINMGANIKTAELTLSNDRVAYPVDCINILKVYGLFGGKEKSIPLNTNISVVYNASGYSESDSTIPEYTMKYNVSKEETSHNSFSQIIYYNYPQNKYEYYIDRIRKELVFGQQHNLTKVYVTYMSSALSVSSANTVPYLAQEVIEAFVEYETARNDGSPQSKVEILRGEFNAQKENLKSALNPMTIEDYLNFFKTN